MLQFKFYLGQSEDCSPECSTSDNSENLLQRGRVDRSLCMWFWWRGSKTHMFFWKVSISLMKLFASHEKQSSPCRVLVLFQIWGDTRIGLINRLWKRLTIWRLVLSVVPRAQRAWCLLSTLNSFQRWLKVSSSSSTWSSPCRGGWQVPICTWHRLKPLSHLWNNVKTHSVDLYLGSSRHYLLAWLWSVFSLTESCLFFCVTVWWYSSPHPLTSVQGEYSLILSFSLWGDQT